MQSILWLSLGLAGILLTLSAYRFWANAKYLKVISQDSLIVFGKKGKGKTLLFSYMARQASKKGGYASTFDLCQPNQTLISMDEVNVSPNTWENVLNGNVQKVAKKDLEGKPIFLDDAGIYLPNFADNLLKRKYASMPIAFAVWRHLYNAPIHINSQDVQRCWKVIREQADGFLKARRVIRLGPIFILNCTYFTNIESAMADLCPIRKRLLGRKESAEVFTAEHGEIKDFALIGLCHHHRYNSRYLADVFFEVDKSTERADNGEDETPQGNSESERNTNP